MKEVTGVRISIRKNIVLDGLGGHVKERIVSGLVRVLGSVLIVGTGELNLTIIEIAIKNGTPVFEEQYSSDEDNMYLMNDTVQRISCKLRSDSVIGNYCDIKTEYKKTSS